LISGQKDLFHWFLIDEEGTGGQIEKKKMPGKENVPCPGRGSEAGCLMGLEDDRSSRTGGKKIQERYEKGKGDSGELSKSKGPDALLASRHLDMQERGAGK